jgi:ATP-binding cassette subfamily B protein
VGACSVRPSSQTWPAGQRVALVGRSGAGKTTVARLIARTVDPERGQVLFGGVDLREIELEDLRRRIVLVSQHAHLFQGTVADNVRLGRPGAGDEEVRAVLETLLPAGVVSELLAGHGGALGGLAPALSAGQRQVVSLARALLLDPAVLVLDEATAHVDPWTAAAMERMLDRGGVGRTTIVVAHRVATAERLDRIVVIDDGRIVDDGAPAELLRDGGAYARLRETIDGQTTDS